MTPKYYVSLGGINLHQVNSFELTSSRDVETYDGIGSGRFNVPDAHDPREWTINCQLLQDGGKLSGLNTWSASELFKAFESWLEKTDAPIRMVKTDLIYPAANISALVWFKSYHPKEADDQGQYDTEIVVTEYKPVGIKTTGIPTVSRPGKIPVPAKVTISSTNSVYRSKKSNTGTGHVSASGSTAGSMAALRLADAKTGKTVTNDAMVGKNTYITKPTKTTPIASVSEDVSTGAGIDWSVPANAIKNTFDSIGKAIGNWTNNVSTWLLGH